MFVQGRGRKGRGFSPSAFSEKSGNMEIRLSDGERDKMPFFKSLVWLFSYCAKNV